MKFTKDRAGIYVADVNGKTYKLSKQEGLTWQDRPYWLIDIDGERLVRNDGQLRGRRFRTLADAKAWVIDNA